jgi:hypothetical protein
MGRIAARAAAKFIQTAQNTNKTNQKVQPQYSTNKIYSKNDNKIML